VSCDPGYGERLAHKITIGVRKLTLFFLVVGTLPLFSTKDSTKCKFSFYGMWGYNREVYTTSTIRFQNNGSGINENGAYDLKGMNGKAQDRPDFDQITDIMNPTIPQYNIRLGMWFNNRNDEGIEINYDHAKYVVTDYQTVTFRGTINGQYVNKDSLIDPNYFHFEHSDGANFWMVNYMKRINIYTSKNKNFKLGYVIKPGFGIVIPRTDVTLFGKELNNNWKISGICAGMEMATRCELYKHFVLEFSGKAGWANYMNAFVLGRGLGKASHKFGFLEGVFCFGYQFNMSKR
jgi:hypothetical protein